MIKYLAIDPGDTFGFAKFDEDGNLKEMGQGKNKDLVQWTNDHITSDLDVVIIEEYANMPWKKSAHAWSKNETSKQIGKFEMMCEMRGVKCVKQPNNKYSIGAMWGGITIPSNHAISHQFIAAAHGVFYLQEHGIRKPGQGLGART
jgi:hypothetical protein